MKSTKAEILQRVEKICELRLGGAEFADIVQYAAAPEQSWGVSGRQIWNYIAAADRRIKARFDARAEHLLARHLLQRRNLYAHAMGAGDFRTALAVLQDEAKLEGLYPAGRTELTGKDGGPLQWAPALREVSDEELAVLARLAERAQQVPGDNGKPPT
jgi:hypothetical protein